MKFFTDIQAKLQKEKVSSIIGKVSIKFWKHLENSYVNDNDEMLRCQVERKWLACQMKEFMSSSQKGLGNIYVKELRERFTKDTIGKKDEINRNGPYLVSLNSRNKPILPGVRSLLYYVSYILDKATFTFSSGAQLQCDIACIRVSVLTFNNIQFVPNSKLVIQLSYEIFCKLLAFLVHWSVFLIHKMNMLNCTQASQRQPCPEGVSKFCRNSIFGTRGWVLCNHLVGKRQEY